MGVPTSSPLWPRSPIGMSGWVVEVVVSAGADVVVVVGRVVVVVEGGVAATVLTRVPSPSR